MPVTVDVNVSVSGCRGCQRRRGRGRDRRHDCEPSHACDHRRDPVVNLDLSADVSLSVDMDVTVTRESKRQS
jgi:hypothetical protein